MNFNCSVPAYLLNFYCILIFIYFSIYLDCLNQPKCNDYSPSRCYSQNPSNVQHLSGQTDKCSAQSAWRTCVDLFSRHYHLLVISQNPTLPHLQWPFFFFNVCHFLEIILIQLMNLLNFFFFLFLVLILSNLGFSLDHCCIIFQNGPRDN